MAGSLTKGYFGALRRVPGLWKVELLMEPQWFFRFPPLDIWLQTRGLDRPRQDFRFGETPWSTGLELLEEAGVGPAEVLYDLGCGRGRMVFLAHLARGCRAVGLELLPSYLIPARRIARALGLSGVEFRHADILRADLSEATVLYVTAAGWSDSTRQGLLRRLAELSPGIRLVTVGWECAHPRLLPEGQRRDRFSWGRERVRFYRLGQ